MKIQCIRCGNVRYTDQTSPTKAEIGAAWCWNCREVTVCKIYAKETEVMCNYYENTGENMDKYYLLVDLDGTLADCTERANKFLAGENPDWDGFYGACGDDKPITAVIRIIENLSRSYDIVMCTGRRQSCEVATREWIGRHAPALAHWPILFRKDGDTRHDTVVKPELLEAYMKENHKKRPFAIFEDRNSMVTKWRELGYTVFQPADGDF